MRMLRCSPHWAWWVAHANDWRSWNELGVYDCEEDYGADLSYAAENSSIGVAAGWLGFNSLQGIENFLISVVFRPGLGATQPPVNWVWGKAAGV
jgi:hypothetical protein